MVERAVGTGDRVEPGQIVAKLEPQNELNALRSAQAAVTAAQAQFTEAQSNYERQKFLLARDVARASSMSGPSRPATPPKPSSTLRKRN
jgi:multidrug efflux pump subunit AcrA (membrane-fusion protein)